MTCHFDTRLTALLADKRDNERVLWALPKGQITDADGHVWDLDAPAYDPSTRSVPWSDVVSLVPKWTAAHNFPILFEHRVNGLVDGTAKRAVVMTREEAAGHGIDQPTDEAIYIVAALNDDTLADYDAGRLPYQSPRIRLGYVDDDGEHWRIALPEVSFTANPRVKMKHSRNLTEARFNDGGEMPEDTAPAMTIDDRVAALEQTVADLASTVAALTAKPEEVEEVEGVEVPMSDDSEIAQLRAEVSRLTTLAKRSEAAALLAQAKGERDFAPDVEAKFADVFVENEAHARLLIVATPKRGATNRSTPITGKHAPSAPTVDVRLSDGPSDLVTRAKMIRDAEKAAGRNITLEAAARLAASGAN